MQIIAVTSCPTGVAHTVMAAEALRKTAALTGDTIAVETQGSIGTREPLTDAQIADADVVILATDVQVDRSRFEGKRIYETSTSDAIRNTRAVLDAARALVPRVDAPVSAAASPPATPQPAGKNLVAITACPTGIAHTFMAAEALQKAARAMGHSIKVETQGSVGAKNQLTPDDIAAADAVVIAADTAVDTSRFAGKPVYRTSTKDALKQGQAVISAALEQKGVETSSATPQAAADSKRVGPYKHLMTGVSYMLPVVIAGGLAIALAFAIGGIYAGDQKGTFAWALSQIGSTAFQLFVAVLGGFIAYSIADRPGIAPGLIGGMLAHTLGAGFLGAIVAGFIAGYLTRFLAQSIKLPSTLEGLKPVLLLPFIASISVGLLMIFVVGPPVQALNAAMNAWLTGLTGANAIVLGLILGSMMAIDMGGPINKAAYTFGVGLLASKLYGPMAAVMASGMTPALGLALAATIFKSRFDEEERKAAGPAAVLGLAFITEGAIPYAAKDPMRVIPALVAGSATTGALSMFFNVQLLVPHGGIFVTMIPGAVQHLVAYLGAIVAGSLVTAGALFVLKRPKPLLADARSSA
jgi:PTS system fructose-specific IIC component